MTRSLEDLSPPKRALLELRLRDRAAGPLRVPDFAKGSAKPGATRLA